MIVERMGAPPFLHAHIELADKGNHLDTKTRLVEAHGRETYQRASVLLLCYTCATSVGQNLIQALK